MSAGAELAALLAPLVTACSTPEGADRLLRELGLLDVPSLPAPVPEELGALAGAAQATVDAVLSLDDPEVSAAERTIGLATALGELFGAVAALGRLADEDPEAVAAMAPPFDVPGLWPLLAERLPGWLLVTWLRERHPQVFDPLALLGVAGHADDGTVSVDLDRLAEVAGDPGAALADAVAANPGVLLAPLRRLFAARGAVTTGQPEALLDGQVAVPNVAYERGDPERLDLAVPAAPGRPGLVASAEATDGAERPGLAVTVEGLDRIGDGIDLGGGWSITATGGPGTGGVVLGAGWAAPPPPGVPDEDGELPAPPAILDEAAVELAGRPSVPWTLVGQAGATRVELASVSAGLGGSSLTGSPQVELTFATSGLRLVVVPGDADSFLATLLGGEITAALALAGRWSPEDGLSIDGAAGLSVHVATTITLGPLTVSGLTLALAVDDGVVALLVTTEIGGKLGPVSAAVSGMGVRAELLPGDRRGTGIVPLGPVALAVGFQAPDGATLAIELGAAGGGWIDFDLTLGRYSGVIELDLLGVGICAVVIIDTRALGSGEWSMFFALFIDVPAIQLGFGFTLTGLGGLFGFNRVLDTDALISAVRSGSLESALFPADPVGQAPEVIEELSALFPPSDGRYVFGPVVRLAWGTPTLIEAELGIVVSLPAPVVIAVLGSVTSVLPAEDVDLVAMHLDVAGVIDATAGTLAIDASLHDSHMVQYALAGDMAVRASFLEQPSFLMALGGFHPGFDEPAGFPHLRRLSLAVSAAPVIDISFECYLAVTSNSVQFGAAFHLSAEVAEFGIEGGASFDALVEFSPFRLATSLGWYVSVTAAGVDLMGVWLQASVEGPNPWLVVGEARIEILGITERVRIDEQIGTRVTEPGIEAADLLTELVTALADEGAWSVVAGTAAGVVTAAAPEDGELVAQPDGTVTVSQRAVPLGVRLDKAGDAPLDEHDTFQVEPATGAMVTTGMVHDWFAPGYFFELAAGERLSSPSFERLASGIEFGGGDPLAGTPRQATLEFEEILRDPELGEERVDLGVTDLTLDGRAELLTGMAGTPRTGRGFAVAADPDAVTLAPTAFAVTHRNTGNVLLRARTWSAAHQSDAGQRAATTVVPDWEAPP